LPAHVSAVQRQRPSQALEGFSGKLHAAFIWKAMTDMWKAMTDMWKAMTDMAAVLFGGRAGAKGFAPTG